MELSETHLAAVEELNWAIDAQTGEFSLIFIQCNSLQLWKQLLDHLRDRSQFDLCEIALNPSASALFDNLVQLLKTRPAPPNAIVLSQLHAVRDRDALLASLNQIREEFRKTLKFPVLWHLSDEILQRLLRVAPDLESWSTSINLELSDAEALSFLNQTAEERFDLLLDSGAGRFLDNTELNRDRDAQLRLELHTLLPSLQNRDFSDAETLANLDFLTAIASEDITTRQVYYERSLKHLQSPDIQPSDRRIIEKQGCLLYALGAGWRHWAEGHRRRYEDDCDRAREYFQQCVQLFEAHQRFDLVAKFINAHGDILERLQRWDELHTVGTTAIVLHRSYPNPFRLARAYSFLAEVALARHYWDTAYENAQQALEISRNAPRDDLLTNASESQFFLEWTRSFNQGAYYYSLARAELGLGDRPKAIKFLETALAKTCPDYEPRLYTQILQTLRDTYFQQGEYLQAFRHKQQQYAIEHQYGLRAFIGAGELQPRKTASVPDPDTGQLPPPQISPAIAASGRDRDLEILLERIGRVDRKLTILYGQSGVGKTSLVEAGLVPALWNANVGVRDVVPLVLSIYTDWNRRLVREYERVSQALTRRTSASQLLETPLQCLREIGDSNGLSVLIFDRFEEFFSTFRHPCDRQPFYDFLHACLNQPYLKIILCVREDCLHLLLDLGRHLDLEVLNHNLLDKSILYHLSDFSPANAHSVITSLTQTSRVVLENTLVDRIVADLTDPDRQTVRPIELQIVGAQLQTEQISTLEDYLKLGERPQETLVQRYLANTLANCGPENQQAAQLLLYLLTDDSRSRPLRTREELERDLQAHGQDLALAGDRFDLVLQICVESGLVYLFGDLAVERYQLVHDYLVRYIRESETAQLLAKLRHLEAERQENRDKLNRFLKWGLLGTILAALTMAGLALVARRESQRAAIAQVQSLQSLSLYADTLLSERHEFDALLESLRLAQRVDEYAVDTATRDRILETLQQSLYWVREQNRLSGHEAAVVDVLWTPSGLISADNRGRLWWWETTGRLLSRLQADREGLRQIALSPNGETFVSLSEAGQLNLWTVEGQRLTRIPLQGDRPLSVSWHPDNRTLAVGTYEGMVQLWRWNGRNWQQNPPFVAHDAPVTALAWHPQGTQLVSASQDGALKFWDGSEEETPEVTPRNDHESKITRLAWNPQGTRLASASYDGKIKLWNEAGNLERSINAHENWVTSVSWHPQGTQLASGSWDRTVRLWTPNGDRLETLKGHDRGISQVTWSPDGTRLASANGIDSVKLWQFQDRTHRNFIAHPQTVASVAWHPAGDRYVTGSADGTAKLWWLEETEPRWVVQHGTSVRDLTISPTGTELLTGGEDGTIQRWNLESGQLLATLNAHGQSVTAVVFAPQTSEFVTASEDGTAIWWDENSQPIAEFAHEDRVVGVAFSPQGEVLATASSDRAIRLWNRQGALLTTLFHDEHIPTDLAWNDSGTRLAVATKERAIVVWEIALDAAENLTGTPKILRHLWGHHAEVTQLDYVGDLLVSASRDRTLRLWDETTERETVFDRHADWVTAAAFSPDGQHLVSGDRSGRAILWRVLQPQVETSIQQGCNWISDYLRYSDEAEADLQEMCQVTGDVENL